MRSIGVRHILAVIASHNDRDHIRGLDRLVHAYAAGLAKSDLSPTAPNPESRFTSPRQEWTDRKLVGAVDQLDVPLTATPGIGRALLEPAEASYQLYCIYPTIFDPAAVVRSAPRTGPRLGRGPNAVSGVVRLARATNPDEVLILFGGDLDLPGWRRLHETGYRLRADIFVVPHHGRRGREAMSSDTVTWPRPCDRESRSSPLVPSSHMSGRQTLRRLDTRTLR